MSVPESVRFEKSSNIGNIFTVDRKLDIVGRFQLAIPHVVFFHPHECSVLVGFGHTSAVIANGEQLILVLCPLRPQAVQLFIPLLAFAFSLSDPVNKFCIGRKLLICQLSQLLSGQIAFFSPHSLKTTFAFSFNFARFFSTPVFQTKVYRFAMLSIFVPSMNTSSYSVSSNSASRFTNW